MCSRTRCIRPSYSARLRINRVSLGVENHLGATKQRNGLAGILVSNDGVPHLRRLAEVHGLRATDNRSFLGGTQMVGFEFDRRKPSGTRREIHNASIAGASIRQGDDGSCMQESVGR